MLFRSGRRLRELGTRRQVLCVTHLPQVAALANHHIQVAKQTVAGSTRSDLVVLDATSRVDEIPRTPAGASPPAPTPPSPIGGGSPPGTPQPLRKSPLSPTTPRQFPASLVSPLLTFTLTQDPPEGGLTPSRVPRRSVNGVDGGGSNPPPPPIRTEANIKHSGGF